MELTSNRHWRILTRCPESGIPVELWSPDEYERYQKACEEQGIPVGKDIAAVPIPTVFDELVLGGWLHLEQMDDNSYWMRVGDARIDIMVDQKTGKVMLNIEREAYK